MKAAMNRRTPRVVAITNRATAWQLHSLCRTTPLQFSLFQPRHEAPLTKKKDPRPSLETKVRTNEIKERR